jgi:ceroid-lipofuscinosis MFS transporter 7
MKNSMDCLVCYSHIFSALLPWIFSSIFRLNMYTAPAYFMTVIIAMTMVTMSRNFKDRTRTQTSKDNKKKSKLRTEIDDHANRTTSLGLTVYDCCILGCMLLNVSTKGSISSFETLGISIAMSHFDMFASRAGIIVACCGTIGVVALLCMGHLTKYFTDVQLICGGMGVMSVGIFSLSFVNDIEVNPSWRFTTAIFLIYSVGYPIGHTAVIGMFSKSKWKNETS